MSQSVGLLKLVMLYKAQQSNVYLIPLTFIGLPNFQLFNIVNDPRMCFYLNFVVNHFSRINFKKQNF